MLYRYFTKKRTYRYIDVLQKFISIYNATSHRFLNYIALQDLNNDNQSDLWTYMYLKPSLKIRKKSKPFKIKSKQHLSFKIGDMLRISHLKTEFQRSYQEQFTTEIFKVYRRYLTQGLSIYKLHDFQNQEIRGSFYQSELQKVSKDQDVLWYVYKIIR
jgi:hypothetical protein